MVLADLGRRINKAVGQVAGATSVDDAVLEGMLKEISNALMEADVDIKLVIQLRKKLKATIASAEGDKRKVVQSAVFEELVNLVDVKDAKVFKPKKKQSNVIMFVGLQGAGKTTTCTKLAVYYNRRGFKVGIVCADTFRAGAFDQLKQNATKAKIPYYGSYTESDPVKVAREGVDQFKKEKYDIILVDTSGRHRQEADLFEEMVEIGEAVNPSQTIMVLDASIGQAAEAQARAFKESSNFGAIILTKMDGHAKGGGAISAVAASKTPVVFIGTGEHIYDLESFTAKQFVSKLLGFGDMQGLMEQVKTANVNQEEVMKNLQEGKFTLKDLQSQISGIMKMGPLSKIAQNLPGGLGEMMNQMGEEETSQKFKDIMYILDSMTKKELESEGGMFIDEPSRIVRVARGCGKSVTDVEGVLLQRNMFASMAKNALGMQQGGGMPGMPGMGGMPGLPGGMNMQQAMRNLQNNPQAMRQAEQMMAKMGMPAGGMEEFQRMMKDPNAMRMAQQQMQKMGGMPGMPGMPGLPGFGR